MPPSTLLDMIVIGSGPAGQRAALQAAKAGKKVLIVEDCGALGGGCVHTGTLPSKSFRESVYRWSLSSRGSLGTEGENPEMQAVVELPDISRLMKRVERVVTSEEKIIADQLKRNKITIKLGRATFLSANQVEVASSEGKQVFEAKFVVIAVGANPVTPSHLPIDGTHIFDSNTIFQIKKIPRSLVVLGGGIIGCEYASMFSTAGTHVSIVDKRHEILASVDREIVNHLVERMSSQGLEILLECEATKVEKKTNGVAVHLSSGRIIQADAVLVALGRHGNTKNMGLSGAGIEADPRGLIKVGPHFQTSQPNVYAVGDVIGFPALAATSMEQGRLASCHAFGIESTVMSPHFPAGIYTIPEISTIGKSEEELLADGMDVVAGRARYRELARGQIVGDHWGLLKMLVDRKTLKIHGVHIIGDSAADLIHIGQAVMSFGGDVTYFIRNVFNYPTLAEAYKTAAFHAINQIRGVTTTR